MSNAHNDCMDDLRWGIKFILECKKNCPEDVDMTIEESACVVKCLYNKCEELSAEIKKLKVQLVETGGERSCTTCGGRFPKCDTDEKFECESDGQYKHWRSEATTEAQFECRKLRALISALRSALEMVEGVTTPALKNLNVICKP